jgi:hypothetical protein
MSIHTGSQIFAEASAKQPSISTLPPRLTRKTKHRCSACNERRWDDLKTSVRHMALAQVRRRNALAGDKNSCCSVPPIVGEVLRSPGRPLDSDTRAFFEPRFGLDFSGLRVHTDERAARSAEEIDALAYTLGNQLVFGRGQYRPDTSEGRRMLAHELAHTVQQKGQQVLPQRMSLGERDSPAERQADTIADRVVGGLPLVRLADVSQGSGWLSISGQVQRVGECNGRNGYNCNGVRCTTAAGRRGVCQWGGIRIGCNCRDQSGDEPPPGSRVREILPYWILVLLSAAAITLIAACFASGVCEAAAIIAVAGAATAAIVIGILRGAGVNVVGDEGSSPTA